MILKSLVISRQYTQSSGYKDDQRRSLKREYDLMSFVPITRDIKTSIAKFDLASELPLQTLVVFLDAV